MKKNIPTQVQRLFPMGVGLATFCDLGCTLLIQREARKQTKDELHHDGELDKLNHPTRSINFVVSKSIARCINCFGIRRSSITHD